MIEQPKTQYAKSGDVHVAYQVIGDGDRDLIIAPGFLSHVEMAWENPAYVRMLEQLASFARVAIFDKRGTGMSDPVDAVPTLEERMDDLRAVMDAVGSERAAVLGLSEGGAMALMLAATYPERVTHLIVYGALARSTEDVDYPYAAPREALLHSSQELLMPFGSEGAFLEVFAPSLADDPQAREASARFGRYAATPAMYQKLFLMFLDTDVRSVLPMIRVPTLVLHRRGDRAVNVRAGRYLGEHIPGAKYVELPGQDHAIFAGDTDAVVGEIEEFVTGARSSVEADRILATVMFTDIVGSTERAAELGDRRWHELLDAHRAAVRAELARFRGIEVKTIGDGFLARFDGPARAIRCGAAIAKGGTGVDVRVGMHTGECVLAGDDIGGIAVHIASRVAGKAGPGEVLVSSTVKDLVAGSGIDFADRGLHALKGLTDEWKLFAVTSA